MPKSLIGVVSALIGSRGKGRSSRKASERSERVSRSSIESLEFRILHDFTTITNGTGPGTLSVTLDAYGSFGSFTDTTPEGDALFRPPAGIPGQTTFESGVYFSPSNTFLAEGNLSGLGFLPPVKFTTTTTNMATSTFTQGQFTISLTQTIQPVQRGSSTLTQQYRITNNGTNDANIRLVRLINGNLDFRPGLLDYGGVNISGSTVYEFDSAVEPGRPEVYFDITNTGGRSTGWTVQPRPITGYFFQIQQNAGIPQVDENRLFDDLNGDRLSDAGFANVNLAEQTDLRVPANGSATFTTQTQFAQGAPADVLGLPRLQFSAPTYVRSEGSVQAVITVLRQGGGANAASVDYATIEGGTATAGLDYTPVSGTLTFAAGQTSATFSIPIIDDTIPDGDETVELQISNPSSGTFLSAQSTAELTILDNEPLVQFQATDLSVIENAGVATITIERTGSTVGQASVDFSTGSGTATPVTDFTPVTQTVQFANGQRFATVDIPIVTDSIIEPDETVGLTLSNPQGTLLGTPTEATLTIVNFEAPPTILDLTTNGFNSKIVEFVLTFSSDLDPATAVLQTNYDLFVRKEKRLGGSPSRDPIALKSIEYDPTLHTVTIEPTKLLRTNRFYEINVSATRTGGVSATGGTLLDGNADTTPGDDFRAYFARGNNLSYFDAQGDHVGLKLLGPGVMDVFRPASRNESTIKFSGTMDGISDIVGSYSPFPRFTDNQATINFVGGGGVLRDLDPRLVVASDVP